MLPNVAFGARPSEIIDHGPGEPVEITSGNLRVFVNPSDLRAMFCEGEAVYEVCERCGWDGMLRSGEPCLRCDAVRFPPSDAQRFEHRGIGCALVFVQLPAGVSLPVGPGGTPVTGWFCGYVRLPAGHPWEAPEQAFAADVFGGITFRCIDMEGATWLGWDGMHLSRPDRPSPEAETRHLAEQVAERQ